MGTEWCLRRAAKATILATASPLTRENSEVQLEYWCSIAATAGTPADAGLRE